MTPGPAAPRHDIVVAISRFPGIHLRGLERELGLSSSLIVYHLDSLIEGGEVESREVNGYTRYFPGAASRGPHLEEGDRVLLSVLREKVPFEIALWLLEQGSIKHKDLADLLGITKSTVSYHLKKMAALGVVVKTPRGEEKGFALADPERARHILRTYQPTPEIIDEFSQLWDDFYGNP